MARGGELSTRDGLLVLLAVIFVALIALYWYFPHAERRAELDQLTSRVQALESQNNVARADVAAGGPTQLAEEAALYGEMLATLRRLVPEQNEVPNLLEAMSMASRREGLELGGITPLPLIEGPEFDTHRYRIGVLGGYHAVARFLTNVGSLTRVVTPVDLRLIDREAVGSAPVRAGANTALVQAEFELRTFVARTEPLRAGGGEPR
jgi:type IV pilus assembly protein PilO